MRASAFETVGEHRRSDEKLFHEAYSIIAPLIVLEASLADDRTSFL